MDLPRRCCAPHPALQCFREYAKDIGFVKYR